MSDSLGQIVGKPKKKGDVYVGEDGTYYPAVHYEAGTPIAFDNEQSATEANTMTAEEAQAAAKPKRKRPKPERIKHLEEVTGDSYAFNDQSKKWEKVSTET